MIGHKLYGKTNAKPFDLQLKSDTRPHGADIVRSARRQNGSCHINKLRMSANLEDEPTVDTLNIGQKIYRQGDLYA
nr:hypothetical protein [uncultured Pseudodesulfovibrio sp.]